MHPETHTSPERNKINKNTKSKRQREAAEVCTLVLCCCQSSCYLPASGSLEKSKRKILIIREFQLPTNNFLNFYRAQDSWTACLLAILHMPNFILCVLQFSSNGSGLFTCYSVFSLREAAWPLVDLHLYLCEEEEYSVPEYSFAILTRGERSSFFTCGWESGAKFSKEEGLLSCWAAHSLHSCWAAELHTLSIVIRISQLLYTQDAVVAIPGGLHQWCVFVKPRCSSSDPSQLAPHAFCLAWASHCSGSWFNL